jgi:DNA-binding CsgD family transcriptional regulator
MRRFAACLTYTLSTGEMVERLFLSGSAVKFHTRNILRKFGVVNRKFFLSLFLE